ncbi:secreted protein [Melampsora americana]|nr:secreted protein [Melampsora americana]
MFLSTCTYILIISCLLGLIQCANPKDCTWGFWAHPDKRGRYFCSDSYSTWSYPQGDCKPKDHPTQPPGATCGTPTQANKYATITGNCPTYVTTDSPPKPGLPASYMCDFQTPNGNGYKYKKITCRSPLTNFVRCTGNKGVFEYSGR